MPDVSRLLAATDEDVALAAEALRSGRLVAFPTETVYGLGAAARDPAAVARIYRVKGRPSAHPVIVHLATADALEGWAREVPERARLLAAAFWPGPMTLVLPRAEGVPDVVTGGQPTVGLRVPDHPVALRLLRGFGDGVAAPSANRFGRISPTTAAHVAEEFAQADVLVLDGGPCRVGLESTIVDLSGPRPRLLRPGGVARGDVERVLGERLTVAEHLLATVEQGEAPGATEGGTGVEPRAPGGLPRHYAPAAPTELAEPWTLLARAEALEAARGDVGVIARRAPPAGFAGPWLVMPHAPDAYGRELYAALRRLEAVPCRRILVEAVPASPAWLAIRDRLRRASESGGRVTLPGPHGRGQEGT